MTKWEALKHYINSKEVGTTIYRKDMRYYIHNGPPPKTSSYSTTEDNYRRILTILGILDHIGRGEYKILCHIKNDLTKSEAQKAAYPTNWRNWFNDFKMID